MHAPIRLTLAALLLGISALHAQVAFNGTDSYTQNFNALPNTAGSFTFENNTTLAGWYVSQTSGHVSDGATSGDYPLVGSGSRTYSWGTGASSDRALGYFNRTSTPATGRLGLQLQNTSGGVIDAITLTFDVEQWRRNTGDATLSFGWLTTADSGSQLTGSYTTDERGGLTGFTTTSSGSGVNGNSSSQTLSFTLTSLDWQDGEYLWLRWTISGSTSTSAGIGLDDLTVATAIPEPASMAVLLGVGGLLASTLRRRR